MLRKLLLHLLDIKESACENLCDGDICYNCGIWMNKEEALNDFIETLEYKEIDTTKLSIGDIICRDDNTDKLAIIGSVNVDEQSDKVNLYLLGYELMIEEETEVNKSETIKVYGHINPPFDNWLVNFIKKDEEK